MKVTMKYRSVVATHRGGLEALQILKNGLRDPHAAEVVLLASEMATQRSACYVYCQR